MKRSELLASIFRTLQLTMLCMIVLDIESWLWWLVWAVTVSIDAGIDVAIREGK